jgi:hypothetical protein
MQFDGKDFTFTMEDATKTGTERTWLGSNSAGVTYRLMTYEVNSVNSWALYSPTTSTYDFYANVISGLEVYTDPWDATNWFDNVNEYMDTGTVTWTVSEAVQSENTWSGYKAVFDSTAGTWSFESDATAGLTYNFMTPSVGGVYDADCTMIASLDTGEISLLSPHNMTSYDNGTWSVIASYEENSSTPAWKVFDGTVGSTNTGYWSAYGKTDAYITCTRTAPFVPKLIKMHEANYFWCIGGTLVVSGSNGNDEWIELFNGANPMTAQSPDYYSLALDNNAAYRSIKLHFSGVQNRVFLSELEIWGR